MPTQKFKVNFDEVSEMPGTIANLFLDFSNDRLQLFTSRIVDCIGRLSNEQFGRKAARTRTRLAISFCISAATCSSGSFQALAERVISAIEIPSSPHSAV